jgi:hypothetical protein
VLRDLLFPLPALAVGILVMRASGVPATAWGQNLVAGVIGILLCFVLARPRSPRRGEAGLLAAGALALGCLAATWLDPGVQDVHRWLRLGPVRLHPGALVLPVVLATLAELERAGRRHASTLLAIATALLLALQPDAAQATAFAAGAVVLLLPRKGAERRGWIRLVPLLALAALSWLRRDPLAPVPHVEGIVGLAMELGTGWGAAAVASLLLLPVPFFAARGGGRRSYGPRARHVRGRDDPGSCSRPLSRSGAGPGRVARHRLFRGDRPAGAVAGRRSASRNDIPGMIRPEGRIPGFTWPAPPSGSRGE